jgi:YVTN family beta-propeller protein
LLSDCRIDLNFKTASYIIDTSSNIFVGKVQESSNPGAYGIAISPDGSEIYVTNRGTNSVSVINSNSDTVTTTVPVGNDPHGVAVSPDGAKVYVANYGSNTVSVIDTADNSVISDLNVGPGPFGVGITPDGTKVYVVNRGTDSRQAKTVSVIDTSTNTVIETITVGTNPKAFGLFISSSSSSTPTSTVTPTSTSSSVTPVPTVVSTPSAILSTLPQASFISSVTSGTKPLKVLFYDKSAGSPTAWSWDFGDGAKSTVQNPVHVYSSVGNFKVILTVSNDAGSAVSINYVNVANALQPSINTPTQTAEPTQIYKS